MLEVAAALDDKTEAGRDLIAVALFYAAVHYINAYFAHCDKAIPRLHGTRASAVQSNLGLKTIFTEYRDLQTYSETGRYDTKSCTQEEIEEARECFNSVKSRVEHLLKPLPKDPEKAMPGTPKS